MKYSVLLITASFFTLTACGKQQAVSYNAYGVHKGAGSTGIHTVLEGDTVYEIAQNYQLPMREIITLNHIQAPYTLQAGFRMKLPPPNEHEVKEGDTVEIVAKMYEVSPSQLVKLNDLTYPYRLTIGQKLRLPAPTQKVAVSQPQAIQPESWTGESAAVQGVQREPIGNSAANTAVTPDRKPAQVQQASTARASIPQAETPKLSGNGQFMRPVEGRIISTYGPKADGLHNDGINIQAPKGSPVRAAQNGVVVYTGDDLAGYGNLVLIRHDGGLMSAYAHLDKTLIKRGEQVMRGQSIGTVGTSGHVDAPQLHFEIRRGSKAINPTTYL
jgi:murein DD-endopeptidase MepM/ murein hydrolase activator NlpD